MTLALFDLDKTILSEDSDYTWSAYLRKQGIVDCKKAEGAIKKFDEDYERGELDIFAYNRFVISQVKHLEPLELQAHIDRFVKEEIPSLIRQDAVDAIDQHKQQGDTVVIITATVRYISEPIAKLLGVDHVLATEPVYKASQLTGEIKNPACYQIGKYHYLKKWMDTHSKSLIKSTFYSDSNNDIPLLKVVDTPVAVTPDPLLNNYAKDNGWSVKHWN